MEDLNHRFHANRCFVHSWFMDLGNPFEAVAHYFLIEKMIGLGY